MRFRAFAAASSLVLSALCSGCFVYGESLLEPTGSGGSGGAGGSTTTSTGTETTMSCSKAEDCPDPGTPCLERVCTDGACGTMALPNTELEDPVPGNCRGLVCDSGGGSIEVEKSGDVPDDMNPCTLDLCEFGDPAHKPKIGYACGPTGMDVCNDKGECVECIANTDCASNVCKDFACAPASCNDGAKNGSETDTDCGGACPDCVTGKACNVSTDCKSGVCQASVCQPSCTDELKNNAETDIDCGGPACPKCTDGKTCAGPTDCQSNICSQTKCAAPSCSDGIKNGTETDVDCGGPTCPSCALDHIVINEVDYDQLSTDTMEFVEIYNATVAPVSMANLKLVLVNGSTNAQYAVVDLSPAGILAPGQYLVVRSSNVTVADGAVTIDFPGTDDQIQNGSPDGLALIDDGADMVIDVFSYEGAITTADLSLYGLGIVSLVEGVALSSSVKDDAGGSLCRLPSSKDTNSAAADWALSATPTPGAANVP